METRERPHCRRCGSLLRPTETLVCDACLVEAAQLRDLVESHATAIETQPARAK
jgi:hypothetical protein